MACHSENAADDADVFKNVFKYYKRKKPSPSFDRVIDFSRGCENGAISFRLHSPDLSHLVGLKPLSEWEAFKLEKHPGFVFIENPFTDAGQQYWMKRCLRDYPCRPNKRNLDAHLQLEDDFNIFEMSLKSRKDESVLNKLRWVTLGYHHNWDTKKYSGDNFTALPEDLLYLSRYIASVIGCNDYEAQAAIVNYYHLDSTLAGHTDHSEFDQEAPLISVSFGPTAIFLLGGLTKSVEPTAIYLRSGDVCIMSGQCRLAYHGVPRIIPFTDHSLPSYLVNCVGYISCKNQDKEENFRMLQSQESVTDELTQDKFHLCALSGEDPTAEQVVTMSTFSSGGRTRCQSVECHKVNQEIQQEIRHTDFSDYIRYTATSRINMNIRQVLKPGETFPEES